MKYTQKDICRLLNITRETLRHYEREGLIHPEVSPDNHYRYYDDYQMYLIAECRRYQANEFSLGEIREMLTGDSLDTYISRIRSRNTDFLEKAEYYRRLADTNSIYLERLERIRQDLNQIQTVHLRPIRFVPEKTGRVLYTDPVHTEASGKIMEQLSFTFMMAFFPDISQDAYEWGFGLRDSSAGRKEDGNLIIPECMALRTVIDTGADWDFHVGCFRLLKEYADQHSAEITGSAILRQLVCVHEGDSEHRYFEAYLPLKEK